MKLRKALGYEYGFQAIFVHTFDSEGEMFTIVFDKPKQAKRYIKEEKNCSVEVLFYNEITGESGFEWCDYQDGKATTISPIGLWYGGITKKELERERKSWVKGEVNESA
jgi:hypothetical protein